MANISQTFENLNAASADLPQTIDRLEKTAIEIENAVRTVSDVISRSEANLTEFTGEGLDEIMALSREARKTSAAIHELARSLDENPSRILYQPARQGVEIAP